MQTQLSPRPLHPAFSAPAQKQLFNQYRDPRYKDFQNRWMYLWNIQNDHFWFPKDHIYIHKDFHPLLDQAFTMLQQKVLHHEIQTFDGCFNIRNVRGGSPLLSVHSWGCAIDLNAETNHLGSSGTWSQAFIDVMKQCHIYCGQEWMQRKDPMHFSLVNG